LRVWLSALTFAVCCAAQSDADVTRAERLNDERKFNEAIEFCQAKLAAMELAGKDETLEATALLNVLSRALTLTGRVREAAPVAAKSLRISEAVLPRNDVRRVAAMKAAAQVHSWNGEFAEARLLSERALELQTRVLGPQHVETLDALHNLAANLFQLGNYADSAPLFERELAGREAAEGGRPTHELSQTLTGLAFLRWKLGRQKEAVALMERSLEVRRKVSGDWNVYTAAALHNLAVIVEDQNRKLDLELEALRIREKAWGPGHPNIANGLQTLGSIEIGRGNLLTAREHLQRSLDIREKTLGGDHADTGQALYMLAYTFHKEDPARSVDLALRAEGILAEWTRANLRSLSEREGLTVAAQSRGGLHVAIDALLNARPDEALRRRVWDAAVRGRSLVLDEMIWRKKLPDQGRLAEARMSYSKRVLAGRGKQDAATYADELRALRLEIEMAERELSTTNSRFREGLEESRAGFDQVEKSLPGGTALIGYVRYDREDVCRYGAFVRGGAGHVGYTELGTCKEIDLIIERWRKGFGEAAASGGRSAKLTERAHRAAGLLVRKSIWDPLAGALVGAAPVFVVPDGALHLVNFGALPSGPGYLIETAPPLHYLNNERDLLARPRAPASGGLLAVGNPDFEATATATARHRGADTSCFDPMTLQFESLPSSGLEAREVLAAWTRAGGNGSLLERGQATEAAVRQSAGGRRVIHFATHGFFFRSHCGARNALVNPLSLTGLALAGSNRRGQGLLTGDKVLQLDLQGTEWAVLSGCDTGLGDVGAGDGVLGLRRAFQVAGAGTVIMSLWPVEDASARKWMAALYRNRLARSMGTAEAVRAASLGALRELRAKGAATHPLYWAPFIAAGDWR